MKHPELFKDGEAFVESMEELIKRYQAAIKEGTSKSNYEHKHGMKCLLCHPIGVYKDLHYYYKTTTHTEACSALGCPWVVIMGMTCDAFKKDVFSPPIYQFTNTREQRNRVRQLRNWIKIYKNHMNKIDNK